LNNETNKINININFKKIKIMSENNVMKSKRFVVRKSLIGKNQLITFTTKKGDEITYNHDIVYNIMKDTLSKLPCWEKYKSYTATNNIPMILRGKEILEMI
tara:strand:- start:418 stop:720 length:303 start_codon:yes stop_codon:yes gene_type:complete